jgi:hypothetical protein
MLASMQVVRNFPGAPDSPLYEKTNEPGKTMITKVVGWVNSSIPVSKAYKWVHTTRFSQSTPIKDEIVIRYCPSPISETNLCSDVRYH